MSALAAYCINLEKRQDRWQECLQNYAAQGLPSSLVQRWPACEDASFGALGCAKSHVAVLSDYLTQRSEPYCLVLEDDFDLLQTWPQFVDKFNHLQTVALDWDALLLAGTLTVAFAESPPGVARVVDSQTTSGYLLKRSYVPQVLHSFAQSVVMLEKFKDQQPRVQWTMRFAIDQAWKSLQRADRWFIFTPAMGHQRQSFSDIEQATVDYTHLSWRGSAP